MGLGSGGGCRGGGGECVKDAEKRPEGDGGRL